LSTDEEERLLARSRQGDRSAHATLLRRSLRLVPAIAQHYLGRGANLLDLIEHGNAGLLRAVEAYDPHDGPFCVLAAKQIARAIEAFLRRCGGASPPTRQIISGAQ
jgi:DNA-directed RNA polymerase sigma subunit (sigma70/sigma32)